MEFPKTLCFFLRQQENKVEQIKVLIRQYEATQVKYSDSYKIICDRDITEFVFENPTDIFTRDLKKYYSIELRPCNKI